MKSILLTKRQKLIKESKMSVVTDLILTAGPGEKEDSIISGLRNFEVNGNPFVIVSINDRRLPEFWYGGSKGIGSCVFMGAYNHLDVERLINFLRFEMTWEDPEDVQLIIKNENEFRFKIIDIFPELV